MSPNDAYTVKNGYPAASKLIAETEADIQGVPLATKPGISLIVFTTNEDIATKFEAGLPHCVRNLTTS